MQATLLLVCALTLVGCQIASCNVQVRHLQLNEAHLIDTGANSFALTSPELRQGNWQTISVNGDNVIIYGSNCEQHIRTTQSLTDAEKIAIQNAKQMLQSSESSGTMTNSAFGVGKYTLTGNGQASISNSNNMHMSSFSNNHLSFSKSDDGNSNNFVISKSGMPNNIAMIMSTGPNIAFVYNDGQVQMKPATCLQPAEQQLMQQVRAEIQQADQQFKASMNQFQNHMHNMQQQLQQNMQNMQQQMQQNMGNMQQQMQSSFGNMFGGYPNPAAGAGYGQQLSLPYPNQNAGPYINQASYSNPTAGLLGNIFSGLTRQFQRPYQPPVMQQSTGLWPFG